MYGGMGGGASELQQQGMGRGVVWHHGVSFKVTHIHRHWHCVVLLVIDTGNTRVSYDRQALG